MNEIVSTSKIVPVARTPISVRLATIDDIPFIDELQKLHQKMLGWTPRKTIEGKIAAGHVLVAENVVECSSGGVVESKPNHTTTPLLHHSSKQLGYVISQDKYMGHEDLGIIYQMNVKPGHQRNLIGASLVKAVFERAAYGCRLFCCWCAQDIAANYFWESLGFVPLAFRAGNRAKARVHIFWQRRIREGDVATPYWFPSETRGGMMNEARLVLPIPPGTSWRDVKPLVLPGIPTNQQVETKALPGERRSRAVKPVAPPRRAHLQFGLPAALPAKQIKPNARPKPEKRPRMKNDPRYVAAARELRDRYLESVESGKYLPPEPCGKYEVTRQLAGPGECVIEPKLLAA